MTTENLQIQADARAAATACARWMLEELQKTVGAGGLARIAISGGSTPRLMFEALTKAPFDWSRVHVFWVDERCVPPTDAQSNYKMAAETLLTPARIPAANVHRIRGEAEPAEAAAEYVKDLRVSFGLGANELPSFDIIHRGIGPDAHTASLFPGEPLIGDRTGIAAPVYVEKFKMHRVTLLPGVLLAARKTAILAAGDDKAEALYQVLRGPEDPFRFPCQLAARGASNTTWFIDRAAAHKL